MSMTTDPATRAAFIAGLRDLADFLDTNPNVAVSVQETRILIVPTADTDEENCREIDEFAAASGAAVFDDLADTGEYNAALTFGPVEYMALTYTAERLAASEARRSYCDNVQPDADPVELGEAA